MDIDIEDGKIVADKENYLNATITLTGNGYCPDFKATAVKIRGRGNSSWTNPVIQYNDSGKQVFTYNPKNPYRLKFDKKQSLAGLKKGKNWVLLANSQRHSMLSNAFGMALARIVGTLSANNIVPVDLYINGEYRGNYNLTEKVGISANSIDVDDESTAVLLELDTYFDEEYKFMDTNYPSLPVMVKDPDLGDKDIKISLPQIRDSIASLTADIKAHRDISSKMDTTMLARYLLVNMLICNQELLHPKSTYLFREHLDDNKSKWQFGPVWDLDWAYGYEEVADYGTVDSNMDFYQPVEYKMENVQFWKDLTSIPSVQKAYRNEWQKFMNGGLDKLMTYCKEYYDLVKPSLQRDCEKWGQTFDYDTVYNNMTSWLNARANTMYSNISTGISSVKVNPSSSSVTVYNLSGQKVLQDKSSLPSGIYIVNGEKVVFGR